MKLGASATSPGVTARWVSRRNWHGPVSVLDCFGSVSRNSRLMRRPGRLWFAYVYGLGEIGAYPHRWQAKRAVEATVADWLRGAP